MAHALGIARLDVYLQYDRPLDDPELGAIRELLRRRGRGEPVAHLTGRREFHGRSFRVSPDVLIPRPETESLVERALVAARERSGALRIADLGTGSGCLAISLACELPAATVIAVDLEPRRPWRWRPGTPRPWGSPIASSSSRGAGWTGWWPTSTWW